MSTEDTTTGELDPADRLRHTEATHTLMATVKKHANAMTDRRPVALADVLNATDYRELWQALNAGQRVAAVELAWGELTSNIMTAGDRANVSLTVMDIVAEHRRIAAGLWQALADDHAGQYAGLVWLGRWLGLGADQAVEESVGAVELVTTPTGRFNGEKIGRWVYRTATNQCGCGCGCEHCG